MPSIASYIPYPSFDCLFDQKNLLLPQEPSLSDIGSNNHTIDEKGSKSLSYRGDNNNEKIVTRVFEISDLSFVSDYPTEFGYTTQDLFGYHYGMNDLIRNNSMRLNFYFSAYFTQSYFHRLQRGRCLCFGHD